MTLPDPSDWLRYKERVGFPSAELRGQFPDFLVVSPARTGTTWLDANLRRHPQICAGPKKEIRYFDSRWRQHDVNWYCQLFSRQQGQVSGDVSPPYSLLPSFAVRHIRALKPDLKIVLLLREPIARALSHLEQTFCAGEANFASHGRSAVEPSFDECVRNLVDDFTLSSGDYASIIRRWLDYFPQSQFHIGFLEAVEKEPETYFRNLLQFLGVDHNIPLDSRALHDRVNRGGQWLLTSSREKLNPWANRLFDRRRLEIERLLQTTFHLQVPWNCLTAREAHADPLHFPDHPDIQNGWIVELGDGWFQGRHAKDTNSHDGEIAGRPSESLCAEFLFDLFEKLGAYNTEADNTLRSAGLSVEDRRLARQLDTIAHSASGPI